MENEKQMPIFFPSHLLQEKKNNKEKLYVNEINIKNNKIFLSPIRNKHNLKFKMNF